MTAKIVLLLIAIALLSAGSTPGCRNATALDLRIEGIQNPDSAEFSGMCMLEDYLLLVPQNQARLYWISLHDLDEAIERDARSIRVESTDLPGKMPRLWGSSGWEAIATRRGSGADTLYLLQEDARGEHGIYCAEVRTDGARIEVGTVEHITQLPCATTSNYAYESLVCVDDGAIIAIPELSSECATAVRVMPGTGEARPIAMPQHHYRISDASAVGPSGTHFLATSFCHTSDRERCELTTAGGSRSMLLCLRFDGNSISIDAEVPVPLAAFAARGEYNAEGLVAYRDGVLLVNDNSPGENETTLRFLNGPDIRALRSRCKEPHTN